MTRWASVLGYENRYEVSTDGRVRVIGGKEVGQSLSTSGYLIAHLSQPRASWRVHRLVALAFIPNPHGKREVNHIDGVKTNNALANLEWATSQENRKHAWSIGLRNRSHLPIHRGEKKPNAKLTMAKAAEARLAVAAGEQIVSVARRFGVDRTTIRDVIRGKTWVLPAPPDRSTGEK